MKEDGISDSIITRINELKEIYTDVENINQKLLNSHCAELEKYRKILRPNESNESLAIVDKEGASINISAPRWFCHLIGLRHRSVNILIEWNSQRLEKVLIFQVRSWDKSDSPGQIDISVSGHVIGDAKSSSLTAAYKEMEEELGIKKKDLEGNKLKFIKGYEFSEMRTEEYFSNFEWREVYLGILKKGGIEKFKFNDKEVVGLYLAPKSEIKNFLDQSYLPIASALRNSLQYCIVD